MRIVDRVRIEVAVQQFEYHLELRGTGARRRRELRRELRANLGAAAAAEGVGTALDGIGSPRALAVQMSEPDLSRPRWPVGALWAVSVFAVLMVALVWTSIAVLEAVKASGAHEASVRIWPWWGVTFHAKVVGSAQSVGAEGAWLVLFVPLVVFVLAAQPWRPWTHRQPRR